MTCAEFSDAFTTLLNSYNTRAEFGDQASRREIVLDEYEKSVLLTQAQDIVVKTYFDKTLNPQAQGFDDSTRRQVDFSSLIRVAELKREEDTNKYKVFDDRGIMFKMPKKIRQDNTVDEAATDVLFILNEKLVVTKDGVAKNYVIIPINYQEYDREMSKPYAQPLKKQAWRLFQNNSTGFDINTELVPKWTITEDDDVVYKIRYVRRPTPIVLEDLPNGLTIDGEDKETQCELNPIIHHDILTKALELAIATRGAVPPNTNSQ